MHTASRRTVREDTSMVREPFVFLVHSLIRDTLGTSPREEISVQYVKLCMITCGQASSFNMPHEAEVSRKAIP